MARESWTLPLASWAALEQRPALATLPGPVRAQGDSPNLGELAEPGAGEKGPGEPVYNPTQPRQPPGSNPSKRRYPSAMGHTRGNRRGTTWV